TLHLCSQSEVLRRSIETAGQSGRSLLQSAGMQPEHLLCGICRRTSLNCIIFFGTIFAIADRSADPTQTHSHSNSLQ
ncbi:hypothetical protein, partial [Ruegeria sp. HKCCA5014]|uniref:hypothetical protein n=1 Tax=Ruegeria sp. HKCCA5014 TaxID=2682980 RepID=UPI001C2BF21C